MWKSGKKHNFSTLFEAFFYISACNFAKLIPLKTKRTDNSCASPLIVNGLFT